MKPTTREKAAIANRFKAYRKRMMITQRQLGAVMDVTREEICFIERGRRMPHYSTMRRFVSLEARVVSPKRIDCPWLTTPIS